MRSTTVLTGIPEFSRRMRSATLKAACSAAAASRRIVAARHGCSLLTRSVSGQSLITSCLHPPQQELVCFNVEPPHMFSGQKCTTTLLCSGISSGRTDDRRIRAPERMSGSSFRSKARGNGTGHSDWTSARIGLGCRLGCDGNHVRR